MSLCSIALHHRRTLRQAIKTTNWVISGALTSHKCHYCCIREDEFFSDSSSIDLAHLRQYQQDGYLRIPFFFNKIVSLCAKYSSLDVGIQLHSAITKMGFNSNVYICSAFVDMYGKCGSITSAHKLFDEMPDRNVVTWNSLIYGYLQIEGPEIAIQLFFKMLKVGIGPTPFSVSGVLVGCSQLEEGKLGCQVHGLSLKLGFWNNVVVGTGLIDMYSKCWNVKHSRRVFNEMIDKNVITWTSMVTGYAQSKQPDEAIILVREMLRSGFKMNYVTYNSLLSSFSSPNYLDYCRQVHCRIIWEGLESNEYLAVTLVTVYSECSDSLEDFRKVCMSLTKWDQISWNALIAGFSNLGNGGEALKCFTEIRQAGVNVDVFSFASVFRAIGIISAVEEGKQTHALVFKVGYASNVCVQNGIVSMYARCGAIDDSKRVFSSMEERDVISWNSLLSGCAHHGFGMEAIELFEEMKKTVIKPDNTTFLILLTACSHVGFVDKGLEYFNLMRDDPLLEPPKPEHYACVVDLFGRAGYLSAAEDFINKMPIQPEPSVYKALLSACLAHENHKNKEIALRAAKKLLELRPNDPATYVLLSNVLRTGGYWDDAAEVRKLMCDRGLRKNAGYSWV